MVIGVDPFFDPAVLQRQVFAGMKANVHGFGYALFPDEKVEQDYSLTIEANTIQQIQNTYEFSGRWFTGHLYRTTFDPTTVHLTSFSFDVCRNETGARAGPDGTMRAADAIFTDGVVAT